MCEDIYIGKTQQIFKKIMNGHISDILRLLKNGQNSNSFAAHSKQHFNSTMSFTGVHGYMTFKEVKQLNWIGTMKTFTRPNCNLFIWELLMILKIYVTNASQ